MEYFVLDTLGDINDDGLCFVDSAPEGMGIHDYRIARGQPAKDHFPGDARVQLRDEYPGTKLTGLVGNSMGYFIGSRTAVETIQEMCQGCEIEFLPFVLVNHKGRIHSRDYFFINPLGGRDCLNLAQSSLLHGKSGDIRKVEKVVFDTEKALSLPHLFRVDVDPSIYVISEEMGKALGGAGVTNLFATKIPQHPSSQ